MIPTSSLQFCELLCLCIDSLMDGGGRDSPRFQHLGEHQRETMLLHFAEPLQFLHNLDIAHIFEHYYRWAAQNVTFLNKEHLPVRSYESEKKFDQNALL